MGGTSIAMNLYLYKKFVFPVEEAVRVRTGGGFL